MHHLHALLQTSSDIRDELSLSHLRDTESLCHLSSTNPLHQIADYLLISVFEGKDSIVKAFHLKETFPVSLCSEESGLLRLHLVEAVVHLPDSVIEASVIVTLVNVLDTDG